MFGMGATATRHSTRLFNCRQRRQTPASYYLSRDGPRWRASRFPNPKICLSKKYVSVCVRVSVCLSVCLSITWAARISIGVKCIRPSRQASSWVSLLFWGCDGCVSDLSVSLPTFLFVCEYYLSVCLCVCVCVWEREKVCVCVRLHAYGFVKLDAILFLFRLET